MDFLYKKEINKEGKDVRRGRSKVVGRKHEVKAPEFGLDTTASWTIPKKAAKRVALGGLISSPKGPGERGFGPWQGAGDW